VILVIEAAGLAAWIERATSGEEGGAGDGGAQGTKREHGILQVAGRGARAVPTTGARKDT